MKNYVLIKILTAVAMTLGEYNKARGWTIPPEEDPETPGYHSVDPDGYQAWSPAETFEQFHHPIDNRHTDNAILAVERFKVAAVLWKSPPSRTFQGLTGKRFDDMISLLEQGLPVDEVSEWLDVAPEFVQEHAVPAGNEATKPKAAPKQKR